MREPDRTIRIVYTNYRGETAIRTILPEKIWFGSSQWHPEQQWLMDAVDMEKGEQRSFALSGIRCWLEPAGGRSS